MHESLYDMVATLRQKQEPYAISIVVRREAPSSSKLGDKALVNRYGKMTGWIGGGCVQGIVLKESAEAIRSGKSRLVRIGKYLQDTPRTDGVVDYRMTCHSEGQVDIFIEPFMPPSHLVIIGKTEIAKSIVRIAKAMQFRVTGVAEDANLHTFDKVDELITQLDLRNVKTTQRSFIVVATQGDQDEKALTQALQKESCYVGFVSSRKKVVVIRQYLHDVGLGEMATAKLHSPAGIDISAKQPDEVAISIMAELIQVKNSLPQTLLEPLEAEIPAGQPQYYSNPVCGVPVDMANPRHIVEYRDEKVYFCCDGCKVKFEKDPEKYIRARELGLPPEGM